MFAQPPLWFIAIAFLLAIGPLVFIHEMGHYLVARWFGVGADQFSIGFGREIIGWTDRRDTRWKVGWLPLGGYVRFVGDMNAVSQAAADADLTSAQRDIAFHNKAWWKRFLIVLAGPAANFLLAILIFASIFAIGGVPRTPNIVASVQSGSAAAAAGIQSGDRILSIANRRTATFEEMFAVIVLRPDERVVVEIERDGRRLDLPVSIAAEQQQDRFGQIFRIGRLGVLGDKPQLETLPAIELIPAATQQVISSTGQMIDGLWQIISGRRTIKDLGGPLKMAQIAGQQASLGAFEFFSAARLVLN